jgi:hypothetical protein
MHMSYPRESNAAARQWVAVTPSDTTELTPPRGLLVGTAGNATLMDQTGATALMPLQAGYNPISPRRVFATGLTAANIIALY